MFSESNVGAMECANVRYIIKIIREHFQLTFEEKFKYHGSYYTFSKFDKLSC